MDLNNQFNQELLSAYLDDGLTDAELAQVETWLADDPMAVRYLNDLRINRHSLKAMASLPGLTLKSSLADRVLAQTHAIQQNADDRHLPTDAQQPGSRHWWAWGTMTATAAAITWLAILPLMRPAPQMPFVAEVEAPIGQPAPEAMASADTPKNSKDLLSQTVPDKVTPGGVSVESGKRGPDERQGVERLPIQVLLVADVLVKQAAWDAGKFDQLLEKQGIHYEKELIAKQALIKGLIESQVTIGPDADPSSQQDAALVYLDCPVKALNQLLLEIENDSENFVGLKYTTAMGGGALGLKTPYENMLSALREQTGTSNGRGIARLILPEGPSQTPSNLLPAFEVPVRNTEQELRDKAAKQTSSGKRGNGNLQVENDSGESLIILRKQ